MVGEVTESIALYDDCFKARIEGTREHSFVDKRGYLDTWNIRAEISEHAEIGLIRRFQHSSPIYFNMHAEVT